MQFHHRDPLDLGGGQARQVDRAVGPDREGPVELRDVSSSISRFAH